MPNKKSTKTGKTELKLNVSLRTDVFNLQGEVVGKTTLPPEIFGVKVSSQLLAQAVRVYHANQRAGTHDTKTRSEVAGSTRKIYKQKGTGRARHGAITAPIFIGGGIAHGPHPRDYTLTLPQKMKQVALFGVLTDKFQNGALKIVRGMDKMELKTKKMSKVLLNLRLLPEKSKNTNILLVTAQNERNVNLAGRNIPYLTIENAKLLNTYEVLSHKNVLLMEDAVPVLASHFFPKAKQVVKSIINLSKKTIKTSPKIKTTITKAKKKVTKVPAKKRK